MTEIIFGALAPPLHEQIDLSRASHDTRERWNSQHQAINHLIGVDLIAKEEKKRICKRFVDHLEREAAFTAETKLSPPQEEAAQDGHLLQERAKAAARVRERIGTPDQTLSQTAVPGTEDYVAKAARAREETQ